LTRLGPAHPSDSRAGLNHHGRNRPDTCWPFGRATTSMSPPALKVDLIFQSGSAITDIDIKRLCNARRRSSQSNATLFRRPDGSPSHRQNRGRIIPAPQKNRRPANPRTHRETNHQFQTGSRILSWASPALRGTVPSSSSVGPRYHPSFARSTTLSPSSALMGTHRTWAKPICPCNCRKSAANPKHIGARSSKRGPLVHRRENIAYSQTEKRERWRRVCKMPFWHPQNHGEVPGWRQNRGLLCACTVSWPGGICNE